MALSNSSSDIAFFDFFGRIFFQHFKDSIGALMVKTFATSLTVTKNVASPENAKATDSA
jgi:hypothetical protein